MPSCYILHSRKLNKYYVGASKGSAEVRLRTHLAREFGTKVCTASVDDWTIALEIPTDTFQRAFRIEKKIKAKKSKKYIDSLIGNKELQNRLYQSCVNRL